MAMPLLVLSAEAAVAHMRPIISTSRIEESGQPWPESRLVARVVQAALAAAENSRIAIRAPRTPLSRLAGGAGDCGSAAGLARGASWNARHTMSVDGPFRH